MAPCPLNLKECKISFSQVKLASKVEFNFGWHTWKLHYQNCSSWGGGASETLCLGDLLPFQNEQREWVFLWWLFKLKLLLDLDKAIFEICWYNFVKSACRYTWSPSILRQKLEKRIFFPFSTIKLQFFCYEFEFYMKNAFFWGT